MYCNEILFFPESAKISKSQKTFDDDIEDKISKLYKDGVSISEIACLFSVKEHVIYRALRRVNGLLGRNVSIKTRAKMSESKRKLTIKQVDEINKLLQAGSKGIALASRYKVSPATISNIRKSQRCSVCEVICKSNRLGETYTCACGNVMDADYNAARNILHMGTYGPQAFKQIL